MKPAGEVRVLVVEDDPYFQRVLQKRLTAEGYQVLAAGDGREGMKAIVAWEPDLVISDWMMPEVDGLELCQSVKTGLRENAPYFILLTAKGELSDRLLGLETGADDYLVKPCDQAELLARVRAGLRIVLLTRELRDTIAQLRDSREARASGAEPRELFGVCAACRKVQAADERWHELEHFLAARDRAGVLPGLCPECDTARMPGGTRLMGDE